MPDLRLGLFGGFRIEVDGRSIPEDAWRQRKPAALVKLLALAQTVRNVFVRSQGCPRQRSSR